MPSYMQKIRLHSWVKVYDEYRRWPRWPRHILGEIYTNEVDRKGMFSQRLPVCVFRCALYPRKQTCIVSTFYYGNRDSTGRGVVNSLPQRYGGPQGVTIFWATVLEYLTAGENGTGMSLMHVDWVILGRGSWSGVIRLSEWFLGAAIRFLKRCWL